MIKLSLIIPVYNSEKHIAECITSILNQSYTNFELIIIDDGSTDNSNAIISSLISGKKNIYLYKQTNQGVSAARNLGISIAKGEYISFIDSDDYVEYDYIETLISKVNNQSWDFIISGLSFIYKKEKIIIRLEDKEWNPQNALEWTSFFKTHLLTSPVAKLYKKEIITKHNIHFNTKLSFAEDRDFNISYLVHTNKILVCSYYGYNYKKDVENSLTKKIHFNKLINDYKYWNKLYKFIATINNGYFSDGYLANLLYHFTIDNYIELFKYNSIKNTYKIIQESKTFYNKEYIKKNLNLINAPLWQKIIFYLNHNILLIITYIIAHTHKNNGQKSYLY